MKLTLAISTCPNDTFAFDALLHQKVDTEGLSFDLRLADVEELNQLAASEMFDITKLSYHAYAHVAPSYFILDAGSALGRGNGPVLVSKHKLSADELRRAIVAIPGELTTAAILLRLAFPKVAATPSYLFSDIEDAVLRGEVDAGTLIHEGRFTYQQKGLQLLADLGESWENQSGQAIPLGCIAAKRSLPASVRHAVDRTLKRSIAFALEHPQESASFVRQHAQELEPAVIQKHIELFVNHFTLELGEAGRAAVQTFFSMADEAGIIPPLPKQIFSAA